MGDDPSANYTLVGDVDASNTSAWNGGSGFEPVGDGVTPFTGSFDGQGYAITDLWINRSAESGVGPFGATDGATLENVTFQNATVAGGDSTGGLVGTAQGGSISSVAVSGTIESDGQRVGGIAGESSASITDATSSANVSGSVLVGGIVGEQLTAALTDVAATGGVTADQYTVGGLAGYTDGTVTNAVAEGNVSAAYNVGGLVGTSNGATLQNATASGTVNGTSHYVGGLVGEMTGGSATDVAATGDVEGGGTEVGGLVGTNDGGSVTGATAAGTVNGTGNYVGGLVGENDGALTDVVATGHVTGHARYVGGLVGYMKGGSVANGTAAGDVTGASSTATDYVGGLVGMNDNGLSLTDVRATGAVTAADYDDVGGLVGRNTGEIAGAVATGDVTGSEYVGGLVGNLIDGSIDGAMATGDVTATGTFYAGGLSGTHYADNVTDATATGNVTSSGQGVGGLIGHNQGPVVNASATGAVTGDTQVGGLVGNNNNGGDVVASFAAGPVSGSTSVGGLVGKNYDSVADSYWDVDATGQTVSDGGTGLATANMTGPAATTNMTGFDFVANWSATDAYPVLQVHVEGIDLALDAGTIEVGETTGSTATLSLVDGSSATVTSTADYSSDDTGVATVAAGGDVTGQGSGTASITASLAGASDSETVTVQDPANFAVTVDATNEPVAEGETLTVDATVENTGDVQGTQTVTLDVDGVRDSIDVTLDGGNTQAVTLEWATSVGDNGSYTAEVASEDDVASETVTVLTRPNFAVTIDETNSPVVEGETLLVNATVENTGEAAGSRTITLDVDGVRDSTTLTLGGGATDTVSLEWTTTGGDGGSYAAEVASGDDADATGVTIQAPAYFAVTVDGVTDPVDAGTPLLVDVTVENTGDLAGSDVVTLDVGAETDVDNASVSLGSGDNESLTLAYDVPGDAAGDHLVTVGSTDETATETVYVVGYGTLEGTVVDAATGLPVAGASVAIPVAEISTTTDVDGNYSLDLLEGDYDVSVSAAGYQGNASTATAVAGSNTTHDEGLWVALAGEGTEASPYVITDDVELQAVAADPSANYTLANDVDAASATAWHGGAGFVPVGGDAEPFTGSFDGAGFAIENLTVDRAGEVDVGLFGHALGATIEGLALENATVVGEENVGGLVGYADGTTIEDVSTSGTVDADGDYVGGLVGYADGGAIRASASSSDVTGGMFVAGLAGYLEAGVVVEDAHATGDVVGEQDVGGLVGLSDGSSIIGSSASGDVTATDSHDAGGLVGWNFGSSSEIVEAHATGNVTGLSYVGGLVGDNDGTIANSHATGDVAGSSYNVGGLVGESSGRVSTVYAAGNVTGGDDDVGGLIGYSSGPVSNAYATGDVDATGSGVGGLVGENYEGSIVDANASGDVAGADYVGGLVGYTDDAPIVDATASGDVTGGSSVGGLVGYGSDGSVVRSAATGAVEGTDYVSGLLGKGSDANVVLSYATGSVDGTEYVGGLVGSNDGQVTASSATGDVTGDTAVGGLVGENAGGPITETFSAGTVSGSTDVGGLLGTNDGSPVAESYWDADVTGQGDSAGGGVGIATDSMTGSAAGGAMAGFDVDRRWTTTDDYPVLRWTLGDVAPPDADGGPVPATTDVTGTDIGPPADAAAVLVGLAGDGTADSPYVVTNATELQAVQADLAAHYALGNDVDASNTSSWNAGLGFDPIGVQADPFTGSFDGRGHAIEGLTVDRSTLTEAGLFGFSNGTVTDVTLTNVSIHGNGDVGGLVGQNEGVVADAAVSGTVTADSADAGGLVGYNNDGTIRRSAASVAVVGSSDVGGLVGESDEGTVTDSRATGDVTGGSSDVGGLIGEHDAATVLGSWASGAVEGSGDVGGLAGENDQGTVVDSLASGDVTSTDDDVGGLVGFNDLGGAVVNARATGDASGDDNVGGLVGYLDDGGAVVGSLATGDASGTDRVGGLAGRNSEGTAVASWAGGAVTASGTAAGGLVGDNDHGLVLDTRASGAVSGGDVVGGLVGRNDGVAARSYAVGTVAGGSDVGGLVGDAGSSSFVDAAYWNLETTGQTDSAGGSGLTTGAMTGAAAAEGLVGLDYDAVWALTDGYPRLHWEVRDVSLALDSADIAPGDATSATVTLTFVDGRTGTATGTAAYATSDASVATVAVGGSVQAHDDGQATVSATVASRTGEAVLDVSSPSSGGGSGVGGGSRLGGGGDRSATTVAVERVGDAFVVVVRNARGGVPTTASLPAADDGDALVGVEITTTTDRDYELTLATSEERPDDATFAVGDGPEALWYFTVDHDVPDSEVEAAAFTVRVGTDALEALGYGPDDVVVHRGVDGELVELPTEPVDETDGTYVLRADSPGLSTFVVGAMPPTDDEPTPTDDEPTEPTPTDGSHSTDADDQHGFGPVVVVLALLLGLGTLLVRGRR